MQSFVKLQLLISLLIVIGYAIPAQAYTIAENIVETPTHTLTYGTATTTATGTVAYVWGLMAVNNFHSTDGDTPFRIEVMLNQTERDCQSSTTLTANQLGMNVVDISASEATKIANSVYVTIPVSGTQCTFTPGEKVGLKIKTTTLNDAVGEMVGANNTGNVTMGAYTLNTDVPNFGQNSSTTCDTCTRIITYDPEPGSNVSTSTIKTFNNVLYIAYEDKPVFASTFVEIVYVKALANERKVFTYDIENFGEEITLQSILTDYITEPGTYSTSLRIYSKLPFFPENDILYEAWTWYSDTYTATTSVENWLSTLTAEQEAQLYGDGTGIATPVLERFIQNEIIGPVKATVYALLLYPPWGYITHFVDVMSNPATTTLPAITISFTQTGMNQTLELNPQTGLQTSLSYIDSFEIPGMEAGVVDTFLTYWNALWYIVFALWAVRSIAGVFGGFDSNTRRIATSQTAHGQKVSYSKREYAGQGWYKTYRK